MKREKGRKKKEQIKIRIMNNASAPAPRVELVCFNRSRPRLHKNGDNKHGKEWRSDELTCVKNVHLPVGSKSMDGWMDERVANNGSSNMENRILLLRKGKMKKEKESLL